MNYLSNEFQNNQIYEAIAYYRLSKEDRNKSNLSVSDSIDNQRKLVEEYAKTEGITIVDEAIDDGYTGTNYDRPGFKYVLECLKAGKANTVIVKDLSRLGREYIETGRYIEMMFPEMQVRFIAINDSVDSNHRNASDDLLIPMKNLMNENYCRELSKKLRRQFKIQRENGEFINNFAPYGYKRDPEDKHHLIIDENTSEVVVGIFELCLHGYSPERIANYLNEHDIISPYEYKKANSNYKSGFKGAGEGVWNHTTVRRILKNSVYTGELCQGKTTTVSYKVKKVKELDREDWAIVDEAHDAIIPKCIFEVVGKVLSRDIRMSDSEKEVQALAGFVFCGDCGKAMSRRTVKRGNKVFHYYLCGTYKRGKGCTLHNIKQELLESAVLKAIQTQMQVLVDMDNLLSEIDNQQIANSKVKKIEKQITQKEQELEKCQNSSMRLYDSYVEELISREDYKMMKEKYVVRIKEIESAIKYLESEKIDIETNANEATSWLGRFLKYKEINELSHEAVATLIDRIDVYEDKRIHITFNFKNQLEELSNYIDELRKEAM